MDLREQLARAIRDAKAVNSMDNYAAADAVLAVLAKQEPVAVVESWTNGSYSRNYKLQWLRDVNEGARLYALPGAQGE